MPRATITASVLLSMLCLLSTQTAQAYRPFNGTDGDVAELGEFELELGPVQLLHAQRRNYLLAPATVLNFGILPRTELVIDFVGNIPLFSRQGEARYSVGDTDVFLKVLLLKGVLQDEPGPSIALEAGPLTPEINGAKGLGAAANLIISERWSWFLAHLNSQIILSRSDLEPAWSESLITEFRVNEKIWPVTELLWVRDIRSGASRYSALVGAIWSMSEGLDFDAAAVVGSIGGKPSFEGRLGFTWAIAMWESSEPQGQDEENNAHE